MSNNGRYRQSRGRPNGRGRGRRGGRGRGRGGNRNFGNNDNDNYRGGSGFQQQGPLPDRGQTSSASLERQQRGHNKFMPYSSQRRMAAGDRPLQDQDGLREQKESWDRSVAQHSQQQHDMGVGVGVNPSVSAAGGGAPGGIVGANPNLVPTGLSPPVGSVGGMAGLPGMPTGAVVAPGQGQGGGTNGQSPQQSMAVPSSNPNMIQQGEQMLMTTPDGNFVVVSGNMAAAVAQQQQQQQLAQMQQVVQVPMVAAQQQALYIQQQQAQIVQMCNQINSRGSGVVVYPQLALQHAGYLDACLKLYHMFTGMMQQDLGLMQQCNQVISQVNLWIFSQQQQQQLLIAEQQQQAVAAAATDSNQMKPAESSTGPTGSSTSTPEHTATSTGGPQPPSTVGNGSGATTTPDGEMDVQSGQKAQQPQQPQQPGGQGQIPVQFHNQTGFNPQGVAVAATNANGQPGAFFVVPGGVAYQQPAAAVTGAPGQVQNFGAATAAAAATSGGMAPTHIPAQAAQQQMMQQMYWQQVQQAQAAQAMQQHQMLLLHQQQQFAQQQGMANAPAGTNAPPNGTAIANGPPQQFGAQPGMFVGNGAAAAAAPPGQTNGEGVVSGGTTTGTPTTGTPTGTTAPPGGHVVEFRQELLQTAAAQAQGGVAAPPGGAPVNPGAVPPGAGGAAQLNSGFDINSRPYMPSQPAPTMETPQQPVHPSFGAAPVSEPMGGGPPVAGVVVPDGPSGLRSPGGMSLNPNAQAWTPTSAPPAESSLNATAPVFQPQASTAPVRTGSITSLQSIQEADDEEEMMHDSGMFGAGGAPTGVVGTVGAMDTMGGEASVEDDDGEEPRSRFSDGMEMNLGMTPLKSEFDDEEDVVMEDVPDESAIEPMSSEERMRQFYNDDDEEATQQQQVLGTFSGDEDDDLIAMDTYEDDEEDLDGEDFDYYMDDRDEMSGALVDYPYDPPKYEIVELMDFRSDPRCQDEIENFGMDETDRRTLNKLRCAKDLILNALQAMDQELPMSRGDRRGDSYPGRNRGGPSWRPNNPRTVRMKNKRRDGRQKRNRPMTRLPPSLNGYNARREVDRGELEKLQRQIRSLLNKITPDKFERLAKRMEETIGERVTCQEHLEVVLEAIIDVAILQPVFAEQYAQLSHHLSNHLVPILESSDWAGTRPQKLVRYIVMKTCENRYQRYFEEGKEEDLTEEKRAATKRNLLGTMAMIGELYNKALMSEKIVHLCIIQPTLKIKTPSKSQEDGDETKANNNDAPLTPIEMEAVCRLLTVCGLNLDSQKAKTWMNLYFKVLKNESKNMENRIKFMVMDLSDLRKNKWRSILSKAKPKKLGGSGGSNSNSNGNVSRGGRNDSGRGVRAPAQGRGQNRYKSVKSKVKTAGGSAKQWAAKATQPSSTPRTSRNGSRQSSRSNGPPASSSSRNAGGRSSGGVVEERETPLRGNGGMARSLSRTSSVSSEGSSVVGAVGDDDGLESKQTENGSDLGALKESAHVHIDGYFSSHVTEDIIQFFSGRVGADLKSAVVGAMLNRVFLNKTPKEFQKLPKLFTELSTEKAVSSGELLDALVMLMDTFDDDAVDAPKLPWIFGNFLGEIMDKGLVALDSVVNPCKDRLREINFCKVMLNVVDKLDSCDNRAVLQEVKSMRIQMTPRWFDMVFRDSAQYKKYFIARS